MSTFDFDVAFSFAGEQRQYVEKVFNFLNERGIRVFYDGGQIAALWGRDLYQHLSEIYSGKAKYCVVFLSQDYAQKLWTRHELKAAQARAFKESEDYLLPARFDDTSIPGLLPTVAYVDLRQLSPELFANLIMEKVRGVSGSASPGRHAVEPLLEASLADAVLFAEEYLQPHPLDSSDAIAEAVRRSFERAAVKIDRTNLVPYLRSESAAHRVTGYIAYQVSPQKNMALDFITSLRREKTDAAAHKETRPLWQLLVCIGELIRLGLDQSDSMVVKTSLRDHLEWMKLDSSLDPGGECKRRIRMLLDT